MRMGICRNVNSYGMICGAKFRANGDLCHHHRQVIKMLEENQTEKEGDDS